MYLREKGISYEEKNISIDTSARAELMRRGIRGVPAFIIGEDLVVGLDMDRIETLIDYRVVNCPKCPTRLRVPKDKGKITVSCPNCSYEFKMNS
ncbi:glutaredoxin family protein [Clostridium sp. YIM B02515]|uniref:Glutaredoxin family protein n=1 Tax=Clostridium rhizosphaerae TaxID=2803861 RepID=A0ABS1TBV1_9CLOT|nr:glutaredoxin family protein [Clostridium rhizosphaerae]